MNIKTPVTDNALIQMVRQQLEQVDKKHPEGFADANAGFGYLTEEVNLELLGAIHKSKGNVTTEVLGEIIDSIVVLVRMSRFYIHNNIPVLTSIHGLDEGHFEGGE